MDNAFVKSAEMMYFNNQTESSKALVKEEILQMNVLNMVKYKEEDNCPSSNNFNHWSIYHDKTENVCHTQDNMDTGENQSVRIGAREK